MEPKYPNVTAKLIGKDGNAFAVLGAARKALREGGVSNKEVTAFMDEATSGDYDHLLQTVGLWMEIE